MLPEPPKNIKVASMLTLFVMIWCGVAIVYTVFEETATILSVALLALCIVVLLTLAGSLVRGNSWGWEAVEFFFFAIAALAVFMYMGDHLSVWFALPVILATVACGFLCNGYKAEKWIWRNNS